MAQTFFSPTPSAPVTYSPQATGPFVRAKNTSSQIISSSAITNVTWNANDEDLLGMHSTSSNTDRLVAPEAGLYEFSCQVYFDVQTLGTVTALQLRVLDDASVELRRVNVLNPGSGFGTYGQPLSVHGFFRATAANKYIVAAVFHDKTASGTLTINGSLNYFQMRKVGN